MKTTLREDRPARRPRLLGCRSAPLMRLFMRRVAVEKWKVPAGEGGRDGNRTKAGLLEGVRVMTTIAHLRSARLGFELRSEPDEIRTHSEWTRLFPANRDRL